MGIIVEDGSIVTNANSYVTRAEAIAYAADIGVTIADDDATDALLVAAAEYIDTLEPKLRGVRVERDQPLAYPRDDLVVDGWAWDSSEIPRQVILAQMNLVIEQSQGIDIYNPAPVLTAKRRRVEGAVEVEYFGGDNSVKLSRSSKAKALLSQLMRAGGLGAIPITRL